MAYAKSIGDIPDDVIFKMADLTINGRIIDRNKIFIRIEVFQDPQPNRHIADDVRFKMAYWQLS